MSVQRECPRTLGEGCTRLGRGMERSPTEDLDWLGLVGRCIEANVRRRGMNIDRREILAIIRKQDESNRQEEI